MLPDIRCLLSRCLPLAAMLCVFLFNTLRVFGQGAIFTPQSKVIFYDDFSQTTPGKFPAKWMLASCSTGDFLESVRLYKVQNEDSVNILRTDAEDQPFIEPNVHYREDYLGNDFTVEYDLAFTATATKIRQCLHFILPERSSNCGLVLFRIESTETGGVLFGYESEFPHRRKKNIILSRPLDLSVWHHFALSFKQQQIKCYLDNKHVLTIDTCGYLPAKIALHGGFSTVKYKNVKVAVAPRVNPAEAILSGGIFVSHSIYFDVNKSVIKSASDTFLHDLVQFLIQHPTVSLEISGHTDSQGNAADNQRLSLDRANAIRQYLIRNRIDSTRLIGKGYGDTRPIQANNSAAGREQNRRVEFVKLNR